MYECHSIPCYVRSSSVFSAEVSLQFHFHLPILEVDEDSSKEY